MKKYILSLDQGTTSSRCIVFDHDGQIVSVAQREFTQIYPNPGWVEHDPNEIWASQYGVIAECLAKAGITTEEIQGIGITNQRETTIVWDRETGEPVYNAIVWQCRRTAKMIDEMMAGDFSENVRKKTGLIPDAYFSASKIKWILYNVEGAKEKAEEGKLAFGTVDTWLMYKLSGGEIHATDYTNASRTMLFNIHELEWDRELLEKFGIPESMMPKVQPSSGIFGYTKENIIGSKVPISGVAGDQQAALFGQCCFKAGDSKNTYGTGCFLLMNTGEMAVNSKNGLLTTIAASAGDKINYALEGSVFIAGAAIQWLRDELKMIDSAAETEEYANQVPDTAGMYIVPAFTGLGAPYWDQYARGTIMGLTRGTTKAHFIRATLESLAYQTYDVLKAMESDAGVELGVLKVDGGASANNFLLQFQSDILGRTVARPKVIETTALGAAYLAGLATGYWKDTEEVKKNQKIEKVFEPAVKNEIIQEKIAGWKKAVECAKGWAK
jgi:glycerol kinase